MNKLSIFILGLLLAVSMVSADQHLPDPGTLPDSAVAYGLERAAEAVGTFFAFGPNAKAERALKLAEERMAEAEVMAEENKSELAQRMVDAYEKRMQKAEKHVNRTTGQDREALMKKVEAARSKHVEVLQGVLEKVPEQARQGIMRAIANANKSKGPKAKGMPDGTALPEPPSGPPGSMGQSGQADSGNMGSGQAGRS